MAWEVNQGYDIEAAGSNEEQTLTYLGEVNLEGTFEDVHVFRAADGGLVGLRNEDTDSATKI